MKYEIASVLTLLLSVTIKPDFSSLCLCYEVLEDSKQILVTANMQPDDPFPMDDKIKEGLLHSHTSVPSSCLFSQGLC